MTRFLYSLALAACAILVVGNAAAAGATRPDDRATHGPGAIGIAETTAPARPDDRANHGPGALVGGSAGELVRPDDRAWRGAGPAPTAEVVQSPSLRVDGFDWVDAGIGAAGALGLVLLLAGGTTIVLRRQGVAAFS
jgi:hypothetical protein